jgi:hypothetical protein
MNFGSALKGGSQALLGSVSQEAAFEDVAKVAESKLLEEWDDLIDEEIVEEFSDLCKADLDIEEKIAIYSPIL